MTKRKSAISETVPPVVIDIREEDKPGTADLRANLEEISSFEGVKGYILRDSTSAVINFEDTLKTAEYAMLSSQAFEASEILQELFSLGDTVKLLVECVDINMHCIVVGKDMVSLFLEKDVDLAEILAKLVAGDVATV